MRTALVLSVLVFAACAKHHSGVKEASVAEVAAHVKANSATICDANTVDFRAKHGVVPGAVLLTNYRDYALAQLPEDKARPVVFYCSNKL